MNGFELHGLKHSSSSQINMFADAPCAWVSKYLFGNKDNFSVAAQVGVLAESVVADVLCGESFDIALEKAKKEFNHRNCLNINEKELKRIEDIEPMALNAIEALEQYGNPEFEIDLVKGRKQKAIELLCKGEHFSIPVIGYIDFYYPEHGLVVDLKTTLRMPSEMSRSHNRQGAIYKQACGNMGVKFLYVTPKKAAVFDVEDHLKTLAEVKTILTRQERLLRLGDKELIRDIVPVMQDSFYWTGNVGVREELYGI